jgi:hypothetical protein
MWALRSLGPSPCIRALRRGDASTTIAVYSCRPAGWLAAPKTHGCGHADAIAALIAGDFPAVEDVWGRPAEIVDDLASAATWCTVDRAATAREGEQGI